MEQTIIKTTMRERITKEREKISLLDALGKEGFKDVFGDELSFSHEEILKNLQKLDEHNERESIDFPLDGECWLCRKLFEMDEPIVMMSFDDGDWEYITESIFHLKCLHNL